MSKTCDTIGTNCVTPHCSSCGKQGFYSGGLHNEVHRLECRHCGAKVLVTSLYLDLIVKEFGYESWREFEVALAHGECSLFIERR